MKKNDLYLLLLKHYYYPLNFALKLLYTTYFSCYKYNDSVCIFHIQNVQFYLSEYLLLNMINKWMVCMENYIIQDINPLSVSNRYVFNNTRDMYNNTRSKMFLYAILTPYARTLRHLHNVQMSCHTAKITINYSRLRKQLSPMCGIWVLCPF